jgi:ADP-heptose:LPS heptosyltransferase
VNPVNASRRLLIRPGALGDLLTSLPALEALRADYTEVWVARPNVPLIRSADRVRSIPDTGLDVLEIPGHEPAGLVDYLRDFDDIVSWYGANRESFRRMAEAFRLPMRLFPALPTAPGVHAVDFYLRQVGRPEGATPRLDCPRRDGGFAVIHPFSGGRRKNWPLERFQELGRWLAQRIPVEWCAGPEEPLAGARRFDDLYELACWLADARLFVGNDSGIAHLAAAAGTPVVVLFGPTDPTVWAPRGPAVRVVRSATPGEPMDCITVEMVMDAADGW